MFGQLELTNHSWHYFNVLRVNYWEEIREQARFYHDPKYVRQVAIYEMKPYLLLLQINNSQGSRQWFLIFKNIGLINKMPNLFNMENWCVYYWIKKVSFHLFLTRNQDKLTMNLNFVIYIFWTINKLSETEFYRHVFSKCLKNW